MDRKTKRKIKDRKILEKQITEPVFSLDNGDMEILRLLNWYNANKSRKDCVKYIIQYMKEDRDYDSTDIKYFKESPDKYIPLNSGWLARISMNNDEYELDENGQNHLYDAINSAIERGKRIHNRKKKDVKVRKKTIQDYINEQYIEYIGTLEEELDNFIENKFKSDFSFYNFLHTNSVKSIHFNKISEYIDRQIIPFQEALNGDKEMLESMSCYKKTHMKKFIGFYTDIFRDLEKYKEEIAKIKPTRKKRKRKIKTPKEQVKKLHYLKEYNNLSLKSINPEKIIGKSELWTYNTKNKKLTRYVCSSATGFMIKGSTLQNVDDSSLEKRLRKPDEVIPEIMSNAKTRCRKILEKIKTTDYTPNGRLNKHTILLKVY